LASKIVQGHCDGVENVHDSSGAKRLPATSVTPAVPLLTVTL